MADRLDALTPEGGHPRASFARGCLFALPISLAMWVLIALSVEKIF